MSTLTRLRDRLPFVIGGVFLLLALGVLRQELKTYDPQEIWKNLVHIPRTRLCGAIALTGTGYLAMTGYDWLGFRYIGHALSLPKIILTAFVSYAASNTIGFTLFSGTAVRYRFYRSFDVSPLQIAQVIAFIHLSFWLGVCAVGGFVFVVDPLTIPAVLKLPFQSVHPVGWGLVTIALLVLGISAIYQKPIRLGKKTWVFPNWKYLLGLMAFSALDWAIAAGVLFLLLPDGHGIGYWGFVGIYILALTAGIASNVPGGLGVFETVIIWFLAAEIAKPAILGALLAYRGIYYFLPLIAAAGLWLIHEGQQGHHPKE